MYKTRQDKQHTKKSRQTKWLKVVNWLSCLGSRFAHIVKVSKLDCRRRNVIGAALFLVGILWRWKSSPWFMYVQVRAPPKKTRTYMCDVNFSADCCSEVTRSALAVNKSVFIVLSTEKKGRSAGLCPCYRPLEYEDVGYAGAASSCVAKATGVVRRLPRAEPMPFWAITAIRSKQEKCLGRGFEDIVEEEGESERE
jgi:hypothetical protein